MELYQAATKNFADAVSELTLAPGASALGEYQRMKAVTEEARLGSERARFNLEAHEVSHQCQ
jgi:hypothetical protein